MLVWLLPLFVGHVIRINPITAEYFEVDRQLNIQCLKGRNDLLKKLLKLEVTALYFNATVCQYSCIEHGLLVRIFDSNKEIRTKNSSFRLLVRVTTLWLCCADLTRTLVENA